MKKTKKKINNLEEAKKTLNKEIEKLNIELTQLKSEKNNLKLLNDSTLKKNKIIKN